jgi:predicted phage terminase large subunit-like protein
LDFRLEAMYGGAAGGGKSSALLMGALQFVDVPNYAALILRRTYQDLNMPGALMDRARTWFGPTQAVWSEKRHAWRFPSGAILQFGYLEHEKQKFRYQSSEFQYIAFDELTQFTESQYRYLFTRLRRPSGQSDGNPLSRVPLRMRSGSNPGGAGHEWVRRRFMRESKPQRRFVPAKLADNPHVDQEEYTRSLMELDPVTRRQMLDGDWGARPQGGYFEREWVHGRILERPPSANIIRRVRYWDLASTESDPLKGNDPDWTAGCLMSLDGTGRLAIEHMTRFRKAPGEVERRVRQQAEEDPDGTEVWFEQEPGSSGKSLISYYRRHVLPTKVVRADAKSGSKEARAAPLSSRLSSGDVWLVDGDWHTAWMDEFEAFPDASHDDMVDSASGAFHVLFGRATHHAVVPQGDVEPSSWRV